MIGAALCTSLIRGSVAGAVSVQHHGGSVRVQQPGARASGPRFQTARETRAVQQVSVFASDRLLR